VEAAKLASQAALSKSERQLPFSKIPLIVHQTYKTTDIQTWNPLMLPFVEKWLKFAIQLDDKQQMAYLFWDDNGINELIHGLEADFADSFKLFSRIEQTDIFRVLACKWFGGIVRDPISISHFI
jgi:mannosyltransferase OCH1-like enzyme